MIFKLFVEGQEVVTDKEEYFEIVKGSVLSGDFGTINREFSTNITLPAVSKNIGIFKAHKLWGGNSNVMNGVAHFGHEAFECLVQLVSFDEKKIRIYIVRAGEKINEFLRKTVGDIMAESFSTARSYVWFGDDTTPPNHSSWREFFLGRLSNSENYDAVLVPRKRSLSTAIAYTSYNGLFTLSEILNLGDYIYPLSRSGNNQMAMLFGSDEFAVGLGDSRNLFRKNTENDTNTTEISVNASGVITISPKLAAAGGNINLVAQVGVTGLGDVILEVVRNGVVILTNPNPIKNFWMSEHCELVAGTYEFKISVTGGGVSSFSYTAALYIQATEEQMGGDVPWGLSQIGGTLPAITMRDVLSDLAIENGKYIAISRDNKIAFKDFPSIDDLNVTNMENYFIRSKGTKMKAGSPLKSFDNYIQYPEDPNGNYSRINIKIDDNRIYAPLTPSSVLKELKHYRVSAFTPSLNLDKLQFEGSDSRLKNALPKFQIFRDTFNNVILYTVEFKNLQEIPEEIMYIPQLNGLFVAEKIIKTSRNKVVVNCYKIQKQ